MWGRVYLLLVLVRLWFALSPSYIHPDEHFQGPEIIAGEVFGYPIYRTWEFTTARPIRSTFPFWLVYGWPLTVLKWIWEGLGYGSVPPTTAFYCLRSLMFLMSFILGDWAIHELLPAVKERRIAILLLASSYVTWTFQTHTFSNSIETIVVLWSCVLIARLKDNTEDTQARACAVLAFLGVVGIFNRITFPAFIILPFLQIIPQFLFKPFRVVVMLATGLLTLAVAVTVDTEFYTGQRPRLRSLQKDTVITPWNNFAYNMDENNLAQHGLHPFWQHFVVNLPQLIGPAYLLVLISSRKNTFFWSGMMGTATLSCFPHQEPRFLLPAVPLLLSSVKLPQRATRLWIAVWIFFNMLAGILFGIYHQGGAVPTQAWIAQQNDIGQTFWWKTYSPPRWLLDGKNENVTTTDLMGIAGDRMLEEVRATAECDGASNRTLLVAPLSATFLDEHTNQGTTATDIQFERLWQHRQHIGLDDLDFGGDGVLPTLQRVVGRRGLGVWQASRKC